MANISWWENARFGMFIHWGLYSATEGFHNGVETKGIGEWIQCREQIPISEYKTYANKLTLEKFNADEWISLAKKAGFKYIVLTAKHHDGFAMYHSLFSDYNITKMSPSRRDPSFELAQAAKKEDMVMCFYYSQAHDWEDKDAVGNTWDFDEMKKEFPRYLEGKCKHQLKELLTNYGEVGLIWFDVPQGITREQSIDIKRYVKEIQPKCLVSGRISSESGIGDYGSLGDNQLPKGKVDGYWESPVTLNHTWGYKKNDGNWKSPKEIIVLLTELISKGVNCLLNIGPKANGEIPEESVTILNQIGEWMAVNGEAVYGTEATPFLTDFEWGTASQKENSIYLYIKNQPSCIEINGIRSNVKSATLLSDKNTCLQFEETHDFDTDEHTLKVLLPRSLPFDTINVVRLDMDGSITVVDYICQQPDGRVVLPAYLAELNKGENIVEISNTAHEDTAVNAEDYNLELKKKIEISPAGVVENWFGSESWLEWEFKINKPIVFEVELRTLAKKYENWIGGHTVKVICNNQTLIGTLREDVIPDSTNRIYFSETGSHIGTLKFETGGKYNLLLRAENINSGDPVGLCVSEIILRDV